MLKMTRKVLSAAAAVALAATAAGSAMAADWDAFQMSEEVHETYSDTVAYYYDLMNDSVAGNLTPDIMQELTDADRMALDATCGYTLTDLDGDGSPELIIATQEQDDFMGKLVLELCTVKDGEVKQVFTSGERSRYYYAGENRFAYHGSNGAADSVDTTYALEKGELVDLGYATEQKDLVQLDLELIEAVEDDEETDVDALCGGWTDASAWQCAAEMDAHAAEVFAKATEGLLGVNYEALGLMGTQVVAGTNYCYLTRATLVTPGQETSYKLMVVYEALDGSCEVLSINDLVIAQ